MIVHPSNYKKSPLHGFKTLKILRRYPKNGGVRKTYGNHPRLLDFMVIAGDFRMRVNLNFLSDSRIK